MICTVSDCIVEITKIKTLIDRYKLGTDKDVLINRLDAADIQDLLRNYKDILMRMEVRGVLVGDESYERRRNEQP